MDFNEFDRLYNQELKLESYSPNYEGHPKQIKMAAKLINCAKRPLILAGAGVIKSRASSELIEFVEKTNIPVAMTLLGLGSIPSTHELSLGMLGMHGTVASIV